MSTFSSLTTRIQGKSPKKELESAHELISQHGSARAKALVALAAQSMKVNFPDAKTFGALSRYIPDALKAFEHQQRVAESRKVDEERWQREREEQARLHAQTVHGQAVWVALSEEEQAVIRDDVIKKNPRLQLQKHPNMLDRLCIREAGTRFPQECCQPRSKIEPLWRSQTGHHLHNIFSPQIPFAGS